MEIAPAEGKIGEKVYLPEIEARGEIVEKPDTGGKVRVRIGNVFLVTELSKLFKDSKSRKAKDKITSSTAFVETTPSMELDLRGMTFDEAQPALDKYLDDVSFGGLDNVTIIHGKGTGALKTKVHNHLKNHLRVKSFRLGYWNEGSYGVTIVEIKKD